MARHSVGIGEIRVSAEPGDELIAHALGSCLGVTAYDPVARVGGLVHVLLPFARHDPWRARENPCTFVDSGVERLIEDCCASGARFERLVVKAAGGFSTTSDPYNVGRQNTLALREALASHGIALAGEDVGGDVPRTIMLAIGDGVVTISRDGRVARL